ncbi:Ldh family oxidoreductase [Bradyrhizobium sp. LHD-71]|uniref:Ldh family oxidoreductase n=1 Tax=Bradyrhizobium sp. LHD-71 TaxID=3072141 RepID=UPI00280DEC90|nr:Ldh family oxidoreductase [Bradyrhizobium sp. LHD-71]MDQ8731969.1 Ldh family oxidoreductase [Bradyrhizobium sp. LHD-71]
MGKASSDARKLFVKADELQAVSQALLQRHGLSPSDAAIVAGCLVEADLRGVETHGVVRLVHYLNRIRLKLINPKPDITITHKSLVAASVNGDDGFGFVVATRAMDEAITMAKMYGLGLASVYNSSHFGMAASYVLQAVREGYMSLVFTNASKAMPPWGGKDAILGTSPFAAGAPGGKLPPFVLDMAVSVAARGKVRLAAKRGEQVPEGFGLDKDGRTTTDPNKILDGGVVLPVGGPKGSAIAMMMDIFSGVFSGSAFAGDVTNHTEEFTKPQNVGHFIMAIKPDLFVSKQDYEARMDILTSRVKSSALADGFSEILVAGEPEAMLEAARRASGIELPKAELDAIRLEAEKFGVSFPSLSPAPFNA